MELFLAILPYLIGLFKGSKSGDEVKGSGIGGVLDTPSSGRRQPDPDESEIAANRIGDVDFRDILGGQPVPPLGTGAMQGNADIIGGGFDRFGATPDSSL